MSKVRMTITLTPEQRKMIDELYINALKKGEKKTYSEIIGVAVYSLYDQAYRENLKTNSQ